MERTIQLGATRVEPQCSRGEENLLLAPLPARELDPIILEAEYCELPARAVIAEAGEPVEYVYFLTNGLASAVSVMDDGHNCEVASLGREGFIGLPVIMGWASNFYNWRIQIQGGACRLRVVEFRRLLAGAPDLSAALHRYAAVRIIEFAQLSACNVLHSVEQRLSRWLLLAHYRAGSNPLAITHEQLADSLGVQRSTVSLAAGNLERAGLISYKRGQVRILDTVRLRSSACECYRIIRDHYAMLPAFS